MPKGNKGRLVGREAAQARVRGKLRPRSAGAAESPLDALVDLMMNGDISDPGEAAPRRGPLTQNLRHSRGVGGQQSRAAAEDGGPSADPEGDGYGWSERIIDPRGRPNLWGVLIPELGNTWASERESRAEYRDSVAALQARRLKQYDLDAAQEAADEARAEKIAGLPGAKKLFGDDEDLLAIVRELGADGLSIFRAAIEGDIKAKDAVKTAKKKAHIRTREEERKAGIGVRTTQEKTDIATEAYGERLEARTDERRTERLDIATEKAARADEQDKIDRANVENSIDLLPERMRESVLALPPDEALEVLVDAAKTKGDDRHSRLVSRLSARRKREEWAARDEAALLRFEQRRSERRAGQRFKRKTAATSQAARAEQAALVRDHREYITDLREGYTAARIKEKGLTTKAAKQAKRAEMRAAVEAGIELIPPHLRKAVRAMPPEMALKRITIAADAFVEESRKADIPKPPPTWTNVVQWQKGLRDAATEVFDEDAEGNQLAAGVSPIDKKRLVDAAVTATLRQPFEDPQVSMAYVRDYVLQSLGGPRFAFPPAKTGWFSKRVNNRDVIAAALAQRTMDQAILSSTGVKGALVPRSDEFMAEVVTALTATGVEAELGRVRFSDDTTDNGILIPGAEELQRLINSALFADVGGRP